MPTVLHVGGTLEMRHSLHLARVMPNGLRGGLGLIPLTPHGFSIAIPQNHFEATGVKYHSPHM